MDVPSARGRSVVVLVFALTLVACGPNWEEIQKLADKQVEAAREYNEAVKSVTRPPSGNAGENAWVAYETRMASYQVRMDESRPTIFQDVLTYLSRRDERLYRWFTLALNNPLTYAFVSNQMSGGGSRVRITAQDGSRIENIDMTQGKGSPFITGTDNVTSTTEGQSQFGDGVQGQAFTDPPNQPQPQTEGGGINNNSSFEPGLNLP